MGIICDGMGGHSCGEVASKTVANAITSYWTRHQNYKDDETKVKKACQNAFRIFNSQTRHVEMGTTMVMASVQDEMLTIAHIEREYSRDGKIESFVFFDEANTKKLMKTLNAKDDCGLLNTLKRKFKKHGSQMKTEICDFCDEYSIQYQTHVYY